VFRYKELQAARAALGKAADGPGGVPAWRVRQFLYCELRCNAAFDGSGETPSGFPELFVENVPLETVFAAGGVVVELGAAAHFPSDVLEKHAGARYTPFYAARAAGTAGSAAAALTPPPATGFATSSSSSSSTGGTQPPQKRTRAASAQRYTTTTTTQPGSGS
jgi:hypothetical protein